MVIQNYISDFTSIFKEIIYKVNNTKLGQNKLWNILVAFMTDDAEGGNSCTMVHDSTYLKSMVQ